MHWRSIAGKASLCFRNLPTAQAFLDFLSVQIPVGQGLSGWVAENGKAIMNGNPTVEPGYVPDPSKHLGLASALAVPLIHERGIVGVLSLYRRNSDAFSKDESGGAELDCGDS